MRQSHSSVIRGCAWREPYLRQALLAEMRQVIFQTTLGKALKTIFSASVSNRKSCTGRFMRG